jgi:hypothetical protein
MTSVSRFSAIALAVVAGSNAALAGDGLIGSFDLTKVVGTEAANCKQCHPSEVAQWEKTAHFRSSARLKYEGNSKKYADALGISPAALMGDSVCADCHGTKADRGGNVSVVSGVSCESCHGPAADWLKSHGEYHDGMTFKSLEQLRADREKESGDHRAARLASIGKAGMVRPAEIHSLAANCLDCHIVNNDKLIAAGHKTASSFELVSWSGGEVRHNFFMDKDKNAAAPSAWMAETGRSAAQRDRIKFAVGALSQIEMAFRRRAEAKSPVVIPQYGGLIAAGNGKLAQLVAFAGALPEIPQAMGIVAPKLGTVFAPMPNDAEVYGAAADQIAALAKKIAESNDGSGLSGLDPMTKALPPQFSKK